MSIPANMAEDVPAFYVLNDPVTKLETVSGRSLL